MILGLDVGGTHTDAVIIDDNRVLSTFKAVTDHYNLLSSINAAIKGVLTGFDLQKINRVNLSTTLSTNAIVEGVLEKVGMIISSGPGIDPRNFAIDENCHIVEGSIDHRGSIVKELDQKELEKIVKKFQKQGIKVFAAVTKFSTRNPDSENNISQALSDMTDFITMGHKLSGQLSFPRRVTTAYYNSAVWRVYNGFADAIDSSMMELGIDAKINILKADGGTMPLNYSRNVPVETILSGPAASILGILALCRIRDDAIVLDIGGTTTDIAIFVQGVPLIERQGISFDSRPTLVRSLETRSIGIGGDSAIFVKDGVVTVGPERRGPSMAEGGSWPTLVDAFNTRGIISFKNRESSLQGLGTLAGKNGMTAEDLAAAAIGYAVDAIKNAVDRFITELNDKPVYTIHEMIEGVIIKPVKIYAMGGPVQGFVDLLKKKFGMDVIIPDNYDVANAIGAALAKTTMDIELFADTGKGDLIIPNLDIRRKVSHRYGLEDAESDAKNHLWEYAKQLDPRMKEEDVEIIESSSFKMVSGYFSSGKDIRVKCQIKPGVTLFLGR